MNSAELKEYHRPPNGAKAATHDEWRKPTAPLGANPDEWHLFLNQLLDSRAIYPNSLMYVALKISAALQDERERCAKIAEAHKGSYAKKASYKDIMRQATPEAITEIRAEERGEDIAAEIIARNIRAESQP